MRPAQSAGLIGRYLTHLTVVGDVAFVKFGNFHLILMADGFI